MSGGHFDYTDTRLKHEIFGFSDVPHNALGDREISLTFTSATRYFILSIVSHLLDTVCLVEFLSQRVDSFINNPANPDTTIAEPFLLELSLCLEPSVLPGVPTDIPVIGMKKIEQVPRQLRDFRPHSQWYSRSVGGELANADGFRD